MRILWCISLVFSACVLHGADWQAVWKKNRAGVWKMSPGQVARAMGVKLKKGRKIEPADGSPETSFMTYTVPDAGKSKISLWGNKVGHAEFGFQKNKLVSAMFMLYKHDGKSALDGAGFRKLRFSIQQAIPGFAGNAAMQKDFTYDGPKRHDARYWTTPGGTWYIRWHENRAVTGYIAVDVTAPSQPFVSMAQRIKEANTVASRLSVDAETGNHIIDISLRKGGNGYTLSGVIPQVIAFQGGELSKEAVDWLAAIDKKFTNNLPTQQLAGQDMAGAVNDARHRLRIVVTPLYRNGSFDSLKDARDFVVEYNIIARKNGKEAVDMAALVPGKAMKPNEAVKLYDTLVKDPVCFAETRGRNSGGFMKFKDDIVKNIDNCMPLILLGRNSVRVIHGYNLDNNEFIVSDTLKGGAESSPVPMADIWLEAFALFAVQPRK